MDCQLCWIVASMVLLDSKNVADAIVCACKSVIADTIVCVERGNSVVECRTRNQVSPGSNPYLLPFRKLGIFVLSIDTPVHSAV